MKRRKKNPKLVDELENTILTQGIEYKRNNWAIVYKDKVDGYVIYNQFNEYIYGLDNIVVLENFVYGFKDATVKLPDNTTETCSRLAIFTSSGSPIRIDKYKDLKVLKSECHNTKVIIAYRACRSRGVALAITNLGRVKNLSKYATIMDNIDDFNDKYIIKDKYDNKLITVDKTLDNIQIESLANKLIKGKFKKEYEEDGHQ